MQDARPGPNPTLAFWDGASEQSLAHALVRPVTECVEEHPAARDVWRAPRRHSDRRIRLTITTCSAYRYPVARAFTAAVEARLDFSQELRERVVTALQEALMNATLHGNLELGSGLRDSVQGLVAWHEMIEARLASSEASHRLIVVEARWTKTMLRVVVRDSGRGYKRSTGAGSAETTAVVNLGSGRGLLILEALCDHARPYRGGTAIELGFSLSGDQV